MPEDAKRYVDSEGLNIFLGQLKSKYANNSASSFYVNYSGTSGTANQLTHTLTIKDNDGNVLGTFNGSDDIEVTVGTGSSTLPQGILTLKYVIGTQDVPTLPVGYEPVMGDVIVCISDIKETVNDEEIIVFKGDSEYVFNGTRWVEFGSITDFVTENDINELFPSN